MKHLRPSFLIVCLIALSTSCGVLQHHTESPSPSPTPSAVASEPNLPHRDGYVANSIKFATHKSERTLVELIPGIRQEVDCNRHALTGTYREEISAEGVPYIIFESDGQVFSTRMGCPDNERFDTFVSAPSYFAPYDNEHGIIFYRPANMGLHLSVWEADEELVAIEPGLGVIDNTQLKALESVKETMKGYDIYAVNHSGEDANGARILIEIVPGITTAVDCNHHRLMGEMKEATIEGWGYTYYVFESDGEIVSTRMGCPETSVRRDFVEGQSVRLPAQELGNYTQVVFVPKGMEVKLRVWRSKSLEQQ